MNREKVEKFMQLAGQSVSADIRVGSEQERKLGAQLLLSEVLEYVVHGLGVVPEFDGNPISKPNSLSYHVSEDKPDLLEMVDGLADVAYTMYWNAIAFGIKLDQAFDAVCDNNLEKFVKLEQWDNGAGPIGEELWDCGMGIVWPKEVEKVEVLKIDGEHYAAGKDERGKVRKPSSYRPVDLSALVADHPR